MKITQLRANQLTRKTLADVNALLKQLKSNYKPETLAGLRAAAGDSHTVCMVIRDSGKIVGMGFLFVMQTLQGRNGYIEDVVVDDMYRGQGLGKKLMEALIGVAKKKRVTEIELTSRPLRVAANKLYQKMGFQHRETNVYKLKLK